MFGGGCGSAIEIEKREDDTNYLLFSNLASRLLLLFIFVHLRVKPGDEDDDDDEQGSEEGADLEDVLM